MAVRGVLACKFNLRSRDKVKQPAQSKVTPKKSAVNTDSDATEKRSKRPRSRNTVAKANRSTQRQLRPRKVVDKNQNTIEEAFKRSSKTANQQQLRPKEQKSTTKSQKTDETNKKLPIYKNITPEKCLEDQDSVYEFTFDPNDTQEKIQKKKRVNAKKQKKGGTKTLNNIKKNKKKQCDTHIAEDKISSVKTLAKQTEELNIKNVETENIEKKKKKQINIETENTKKKKKQIHIHPAEDKILPMTELANQTQELNIEEVETENTKKEKKKQIDIHTAEDKITPVIELAKQTEDLSVENVETENTEKEEKKQIDIHTAEDKKSPVTELAKQTEDLSVENVETKNTEKEEKKQIDIHSAEDKKSPVTELAKQTQELNTENVETENSKKNQIEDSAREETSSVTTFAEQNKKLNKSTPTIISIENVDTMLVNRISSIENFRSPLRPRNLVDNTIVKQQRKDNSNYLSLTKSLSPISNTAGVININSPWRPPTLSMFSRAKYFVQSTPKVMRISPKVHSKINKKSFVKGKENKKAIKKKELKKHQPAIDSKTLAEQENEENKFLETDKEDRQLTNGKTVEEQKDERLVKDKENNEISTKQENKHLIDFLDFSDTFDVLSESERRSTFGTEIRLFEDAEPTHFSEPPKRIYKRKHGMRVNFLEESDKEEDKENARENEQEPKKKRKYRKVDKENEKRISEWIQSVNSSFEEIDNYDLLVE